MRRRSAFCFLVMVMLLAVEPVLGQESPAPSPSPSSEVCEIGALCTDVGGRVQPGSRTQTINDPPGDHLESILTLSFITLVVGVYLFFALSGRRLLPRVRIRS